MFVLDKTVYTLLSHVPQSNICKRFPLLAGDGETAVVNGLVNGINGHADSSSKDSAPKASLRLSFLEYRRISNLIVMHLRKCEEGKNRLSRLNAL